MNLAATMGWEEASHRIWDTIVVGAGPAGAMAARELARRRCAVLLVDRAAFPRAKVCGCCLNAHSLRMLRAAGLGACFETRGATALRNIRLAAGKQDAHVPLAGGCALSRETLDAGLIAAAIEKGANFLPETLATCEWENNWAHAGQKGSDYRVLELRQGSLLKQARARVVISAEGVGGKLARRVGIRDRACMLPTRIGVGAIVSNSPGYYARGEVFMACGSGGYLGMVRLEDGRLDLAGAFDPRWVRARGGPGKTAAKLLADVGWPEIPRLSEQAWRGTPALTRRARRLATERLFLIGDAAGYVEPFTGEGIGWAFETGMLVAPLAAQAVDHWHSGLVREWQTIYENRVGNRQTVCRMVAAVLRSPWMMGAIVRILHLAPGLARPLTYRLGCS